MTVYIVIGEDRHSGLSVHQVYTSREKAITDAKAQAETYAGYNDSEVKATTRADGCIYEGVYSCENDYVAVYAREVQP